MAENQVQAHLIALGRGRNGFFCPESRFHLMGGVKPQDFWPAAAPLTQAVKIGLRSGSLVDVNGTIPYEAYAPASKLKNLVNPDDFIVIDDEDKGDKATDNGSANQQNPGDGSQDNSDANDDGNALDGDVLTEEQIDASTKKDLLAFIKKNEIDMEVLGLNSRSNEEEVKNALKIHFGYKMV